MARLTRQRLLALTQHRGAIGCCLKNPSSSKAQRHLNHMVAVENSLAHLNMTIDTDSIITNITPKRQWDISLHDAIPPHIYPQIVPELKKRYIWFIGDMTNENGTNMLSTEELRQKGFFKHKPPLWVSTIRYNLCDQSQDKLKPIYTVSKKDSRLKPVDPSIAKEKQEATPRLPAFHVENRQKNPYSFSITGQGPHIYITDGSKIRVNNVAQSGFAAVPIQNGSYTTHAKPDGKQCNSKTEALGLLAAIVATPPHEEGHAFLDNSGVIQVFAQGEPVIHRHKLRMKNRTTYFPIWAHKKVRTAPFSCTLDSRTFEKTSPYL